MSGDKTERATPKRLREARERGELPRSRDLASAVVIGAGVAVLLGAGSGIALRAQHWMALALNPDRALLSDGAKMVEWLGSVALGGFFIVLPLLVAGMVAALVGPMALGGWNFSAKALRFDINRVNPVQGLGRMFSSQALVELVKGLTKAGLLGALACAYLWKHRDGFMALSRMDVAPALAAGVGLALQGLLWLCGGLLLLAAIDAPYQWFSHARKLRMSKQEVRDEYKQAEGSPEVKGRIRRLQAERSRRRMMEAVPSADVIVTNPTHYAVALKYDADKMRAPRVVAKGADHVALAIRELAKTYRVPTVEAPPLARALYRGAEVGDEIPMALYAAVAQVLTYIYRLRQFATTTQRPGTRTAPPELGDLGEIPNGQVEDGRGA